MPTLKTSGNYYAHLMEFRAVKLDGTPEFRTFAEDRLLHAMAAYEQLSAASQRIVESILSARIAAIDAERADLNVKGTKAYDRSKRTKRRDRMAV